MLSALQNWLSPRPPRTRTAHLNPIPETGPDGAITMSFRTDPATGYVYTREQHRAGFAAVQTGGTAPLLHIHLYQKEVFRVVQGKMNVTLEGKKIPVTPESGEVTIPPATVHTFTPDVADGVDFIADIRVDPADQGFSEDFIRNFQGYLYDLTRTKMALSPFQAALFTYAADIVAVPPLPFVPPLWTLKALAWFMGVVVGKWILGYKASYPEYYDSTKSK